MAQSQILAHFKFDAANNEFLCLGNWSISYLGALSQAPQTTGMPTRKKITINGAQLRHLDSAGALALIKYQTLLAKQRNQVELKNFSKKQLALLALIESKADILSYHPPAETKHHLFYQVGKETVQKFLQLTGLIMLIGDLSDKIFRATKEWRRFQWPSIFSNMYTTGVTALPIIGLLSFLIGVVLAYQMGLQLETYGANSFIAYLSGMAIFREFSPLITAIIVAGRTSSAFTAQIGSMKINEEIDALHAMGLSPTELLVVPKVFGLLIIFPLLIFWSDFFGTLGAMIMSKFMLSVGYFDFMTRLHDSVGFKQMMLGLYKAPTFALLIALVGCFQGLRVKNNADSLGAQTTKSVVQALFLIIIADATYSVIYSWLDV